MLCNMLYPTSFLPEDILRQAAMHEMHRRREEQQRAELLAARRAHQRRLFEEERRARLAEAYRQQYVIRALASAAASLQHEAEERERKAREHKRRAIAWAEHQRRIQQEEEIERANLAYLYNTMQRRQAPQPLPVVPITYKVDTSIKEEIEKKAASTIQSAWRKYAQKKREMAKIVPSVQAIKSVLDEVNVIVDENKAALLSPLSATYDADRQKPILPFVDGANKAVLTAEERLTTLLIKLDAIDTCGGNETVRTKRKYVIGRIEEYLRVIEQKKSIALSAAAAPPKLSKPSKSAKRVAKRSAKFIDNDDDIEEQYLRKASRCLKSRGRSQESKKTNKLYKKDLLF